MKIIPKSTGFCSRCDTLQTFMNSLSPTRFYIWKLQKDIYEWHRYKNITNASAFSWVEMYEFHFNLKQRGECTWLITFIFHLHLVTIVLNQNCPLFIVMLEVLGNQFLIFKNFNGRNCQWWQWQRGNSVLLLPNNNKHPLAFGGFPSAFLELCLL